LPRADGKAGHIPKAYANPFNAGGAGPSMHIVVELARDPKNKKELVIEQGVFSFLVPSMIFINRKIRSPIMIFFNHHELL
tara:strand:- start:1169 stop:1408 length:240 start_codon:yes stop_codon:yes gene_type:complete